MKNLFYGILSIMLLYIILFNLMFTKKFEEDLPEGIVVEKYQDFYTGGVLFILTDEKVEIERVYEIVYINYNVGDTIK